MTDPVAGYLQGGTYTAEQDRRVAQASMHRGTLGSANGVIPQAAGHLQVQLVSGMNLKVLAGYAMINRYTVNIPQDTLLTVAPSTSSARRDLVIVKVYDVEGGDATNEAKVELVKGTTTSDPAVPLRAMVIAAIDIAANASTVTIIDRRTYCPAAGGVMLVGSAYPTTAPGIAELAPGQFVHNLTDKTTKQHVGTTLVSAGNIPVAQFFQAGTNAQGQAPGSAYDPVVVTPTGIPAARWVDVIVTHTVFPMTPGTTIAGYLALYIAGVYQCQARYHNGGVAGIFAATVRAFYPNNGANPEIRLRNTTDGAQLGAANAQNHVWSVSVIAYGQG